MEIPHCSPYQLIGSLPQQYPAIVAAERLFRRVLSNEARVLVEKEGVKELEGSGKGGLKRSPL